MGKSHLAPNPRTTIPRLELLAAVTAVRLRRFLAEQLPLSLEATYLWSDSSAVLQSIHNTQKRFPVFVANRLAEIERHSHVPEWKYVPSKLNPADEVSKGLPAGTFVRSSRWLTGPEFLLKSKNESPDQLEGKLSPPHDSPLFERQLNVVTTLVSTKEAVVDPPMDRFVKHFSS